jgi:hypothetical protein
LKKRLISAATGKRRITPPCGKLVNSTWKNITDVSISIQTVWINIIALTGVEDNSLQDKELRDLL